MIVEIHMRAVSSVMLFIISHFLIFVSQSLGFTSVVIISFIYHHSSFVLLKALLQNFLNFL